MKAAILAFVGLLLALIIGAACGLLLLAFHNQTLRLLVKVFAGRVEILTVANPTFYKIRLGTSDLQALCLTV